MCLAARYGNVFIVGRGSQTVRIEGTRSHRTYLGTPGRRAGTPRPKPTPRARSLGGCAAGYVRGGARVAILGAARAPPLHKLDQSPCSAPQRWAS